MSCIFISITCLHKNDSLLGEATSIADTDPLANLLALVTFNEFLEDRFHSLLNVADALLFFNRVFQTVRRQSGDAAQRRRIAIPYKRCAAQTSLVFRLRPQNLCIIQLHRFRRPWTGFFLTPHVRPCGSAPERCCACGDVPAKNYARGWYGTAQPITCLKCGRPDIVVL